MEILENDYAYWLHNVEGIGNATIEKLLGGGFSCKDIYTASEKELSKFLKPRQLRSLVSSRFSWDFQKEKGELLEKKVRFISRLDPEYPERLKHIPDSPFAIYVKGRLPDPEVPSVAIIGARMCSDYGRYMARQFGRGLAMSGVQVISGMARGIDGIAQHAAISAGGRSFGVFGCGVDICYPEENRDVYDALFENGGAISEYPPGMKPIPKLFPMRNRIISGLSDVLLVVEARQKSGTSITVDTALEQGREVLAIPGRVTDRLSDGCNYLISQGAGVAISVEDVLDRLWQLKRESNAEAAGELVRKESKADVAGGQIENSRPIIMHGVKRLSDEEDNSAPETTKTEVSKNENINAEAVMTEAIFDTDDSVFPEATQPTSIEDDILGIVDIIPVSTSYILEELYKKGRDTTVPALMSTLMDMTCNGKIAQNGAYYRRVS